MAKAMSSREMTFQVSHGSMEQFMKKFMALKSGTGSVSHKSFRKAIDPRTILHANVQTEDKKNKSPKWDIRIERVSGMALKVSELQPALKHLYSCAEGDVSMS